MAAVDTYGVTLLADRSAPPQARPSAVRRIWNVGSRAHLLALALVLLALAPVTGTGSTFLSDEGAAIVQGRSLSSGQGWIVEHSLPELDPEGDLYPLVNSEHGSKGFAPLGKHPAYALLLAGAHALGGVVGMMLLSLAGTVAAAGVAGALARRLDPVLVRPTIWAVGLASPLFFDGYLVMAHTLGAAMAAAATLCAVRAIEERRPASALAVAPCIAAAILLRSEALLFAGALAVVALLIALWRRPRAPALLVAGATVVAAAVTRVGETAWIASIVGDVPALNVPARVGASGFLQGRSDSFVMTWLLPNYTGTQPVSLLLLAVMTGVLVAAVAARSNPTSRMRILIPAAVAACAAGAAVVASPAAVVPGILLAFPLMPAGLALLRGTHFRDVGVALGMGTSALFAAAVIATQYTTGGTGEWGGRYFALALPVVVPVFVLALHRQGQTLDRLTRRGGLAALVVCSVALTTTAVFSLRGSHQYWDRFVASVERAQDVAGPGRPVVSTWLAAPRHSFAVLDRSPWLLAGREEIRGLRQALRERGADRFVFVTVDVAVDQPELAGLDVLWADESLGGNRRILVVQESAVPDL